MAAVTILASGTQSGAGAGSSVDVSTYATLLLSVSMLPAKMTYSPPPRAHIYVETSRDGLVWHTVSETVVTCGVTSGPERMPSSGVTDLAPIVADSWCRARWLIEDSGSWTLAVTGTAS